ncbi:MAG TPA: sulfotransferase [Caulobacteraceae bacterium]
MSIQIEGRDDELAKVRQASVAGDRNLAIELAIRALGRGLEHPLVLRLVAEGLEEDGRGQDAAGLLQRATIIAPDDLESHLRFGRLLAKMWMHKESLEAGERALVIDAVSVDGHIVVGAARLAMGEVAVARRHYERADQLAPNSAEILSALAVISVRQVDPQAARAFAARALDIRPDFVRAQIAIAQADIFENLPAQAEARLLSLLARPDVTELSRVDSLNYLAEALDAQDQPLEAFGAYVVRNRLLVELYTEGFNTVIGERWSDQARRLAAWFEQTDAAPWSASPGEDVEGAASVGGHVFLLGFPRSGTTLLEQVLASHPGVVAIEEKPLLSQAAGYLLADDASLAKLAHLTQEEAALCRQTYWTSVRDALGGDISDKVFIDKLPLHTPALPLIAKLFPKAKILFARRDPRDVVLSCFRRRFRMNTAMYEFLTLDGACEYYDQVMSLFEIYRRKLPLDVHFLRNEDLVADFEGETRRALDFIGLGWDPAIYRFPERAKAVSNTPSATQVARGLNSRGVGQWRRYRPQLEPLLELLEPWARRFGYPPADPPPRKTGIDPKLASLLARLGSAVQATNWAFAFDEADRAIANGLNHPLLFRLRGVRRQQEGRLGEAIEDFETALAEAPADFATMSALGLCLGRSGRPAQGLRRLDLAIAFEPGFAPAHFNRGWTLETLGELAAAKAAYARALELDPRHAQALGALAALASRAADWTEARSLAQRALALDPLQSAAILAMAAAELEQGEAGLAEQRIRTLLASPRPTPHERAVAQQTLGDILDRSSRHAEAFAAYQAGAEGLRELYLPRFAATGAETASTLAARLLGAFETVDPAAWRAAAASAPDAGRHLFLIGFPRSGTTMTGQVLARHPEVITLDEKDTLAEATRRFLGPGARLDALADLKGEDAAHWRELYWRRVQAAGGAPAGRLVVDKSPMNTLGLPLIAKLFPRAKILFMRRDPRDVVLSCFRRQFVINPTTIDLLTLEGAARLYDLTMRLMALYQDRLELDLRVQSYEALVTDFDAEARALCAFAGLGWRDGLADFAGAAAFVATPSSGQIARGLNAEAVGHWRFYREPLAKVLPLLEPWVERFGYSSS